MAKDTPGGAGLDRRTWASLLASGDHVDEVLLLGGVGPELVAMISRPLVRLPASTALRLRLEQLRQDVTGSSLPAALSAAADDADAAVSRLRHTIERLARHEEGSEPAADALLPLVAADYPAACAAAQHLLGVSATVHLAVRSLRLPSHDPDVSVPLILDGVDPARALHAGTELAGRRWWPPAYRDYALRCVRAGRPIDTLTDTLDRLAYCRLSSRQQQAAIALLSSPDNPYGHDGTAIALAVRGVNTGFVG